MSLLLAGHRDTGQREACRSSWLDLAMFVRSPRAHSAANFLQLQAVQAKQEPTTGPTTANKQQATSVAGLDKPCYLPPPIIRTTVQSQLRHSARAPDWN